MPLPMNPFGSNIRYELPAATRKRSKAVYNLEEALEAFKTLHGTSMEAPFICACFAGCRSAESLAVRCEDVTEMHVEDDSVIAVKIERQITGDNNEVTTRLKTRQSNRTTFVLPQAAQRLIQIRDEYVSHGREWLSDRGDGLPLGRIQNNNWWRGHCKRHGLKYIPWSNLRNSWRTICELELRIPWDLCELMMGHSLPGMSGAHYIRPSVEQNAYAFHDALGIFKDID